MTPHNPGGDRPRIPRWIKILGIVLAVIALLFVAMRLVGGGDHGPWRHGSLGVETSGVVR